MPEQGVNAIHRMAEVIQRLRDFDFRTGAHPLLGSPTLNIGTIAGGANINSVADATSIGVDIRLVPGKREDSLMAWLQAELGDDVSIERLEGAASVETDPAHPWIQGVFDVMERVLGPDGSLRQSADNRSRSRPAGDGAQDRRILSRFTTGDLRGGVCRDCRELGG
jgi:succinyl-diaminopimelate desuccinylase